MVNLLASPPPFGWGWRVESNGKKIEGAIFFLAVGYGWQQQLLLLVCLFWMGEFLGSRSFNAICRLLHRRSKINWKMGFDTFKFDFDWMHRIDLWTGYNFGFEREIVEWSVRPQFHENGGCDSGATLIRRLHAGRLRTKTRSDRVAPKTLRIEPFKICLLICIRFAYVE